VISPYSALLIPIIVAPSNCAVTRSGLAMNPPSAATSTRSIEMLPSAFDATSITIAT